MKPINVFMNDPDFTDMRKNFNKEFNANWKFAYSAYIKGNWSQAHRLFKDGQEMEPEDGPTKTLLSVIEEMSVRPGYNAPANWPGWRELTSK